MFIFNRGSSKKSFKPLDSILVESDENSFITVTDTNGREYVAAPSSGYISFFVGGSLGEHTVRCRNEIGDTVETTHFFVDCETGIEEDEYYKSMLNMLHFTMAHGNEASEVFYNGRTYSFLVRWLRDHVHVLKGMKYFTGDVKPAIELYRDSQRADGMIWDNVYPRDRDLSYFQQVFKAGGFVMPFEDRRFEFRRIPVEADVEYLYIEGIYNTWQATGDDGWMESMLDSAVKAMDYCMTSPYRWSVKYDLIKRGFTIDTWDFQSWIDVMNTGHIMTIDAEKTHFGIMHGDNTGFSKSCSSLGKMLKCVGKNAEADRFEKLSGEIKDRLDSVAWNGKFYTHHVPEVEGCRKGEELGADLEKQVSLSNAYAVNRGLSHEQVTSILNTYLEIRNNLPVGAVGEWYSIYPPFDNFNGDHSKKWEYVNGGILSIVAGELAKGAFEHGYEAYGLDILDRIYGIGEKHGGYLHCTYKGEVLPRPDTKFHPVDLSEYANMDFFKALKVTDAPELERLDEEELIDRPIGNVTFDSVPFKVANPAENGGRSCIALSCNIGYEESVCIPVKQKAESIYLLHVMSGNSPCGLMTLEYEDGGRHDRYMNELREGEKYVAREIVRWYQPVRGDYYGCNQTPNLRIVWQGKNDVCERVGIGAFCLDNPFPERKIKNIRLKRMENGSIWYVFGITLSDGKAYFKSGDVSGGMPDAWGAAAVTYSLLEGLGGISDDFRAFEKVTISPRWAVSKTDNIKVTVRYPASRSYISYEYRHDRIRNTLSIRLTGSGRGTRLHCLMPEELDTVAEVLVNGEKSAYSMSMVEKSAYVDFELPEGLIYADVVIRYRNTIPAN